MSEPGRTLVAEAIDIIETYLKGDGKASLNKSYEYFLNLEKYLFGKSFENWKERDIAFEKEQKMSEVQYCEYSLAIGRSMYPEFATPLGYAHNAAFINWYMTGKGFFKEPYTGFDKHAKEYLRSSDNFCFDHDGLDKYRGKGKVELFYRNASLAEYYAHTKDKGWGDMYTPLILARQAVEQYVDQLCDDNNIDLNVANDVLKKMHEDRQKKNPKLPDYRPKKYLVTSDKITVLREKRCISQTWSKEIFAVVDRGNANTHQGKSGYPFAVIHSLEVLKECFKYFSQR